MPPDKTLPEALPPVWRRVAARTAGICGAALAAHTPSIFLIGWPMEPAALVALVGNELIDYACVGLVVALTLSALEGRAHWPGRWRHALLAAGLAAAVATQLKPGTARYFSTLEVDRQVEGVGMSTDLHRLVLYQLWFSAILVTGSAVYLLQRQGSMAAEQRREMLEAQWQQARRRVRIMRDAAGAARLDPQVLFDCLGLARSEYLRDAGSAGVLLDRLIEFLRGTLAGTRAGRHTLGMEVELALRFAAIVARPGGVQVVDAIPRALRSLDVYPGLVLPLVQQWLAACVPAASAAAGATATATATATACRTLSLEASLAGADHRLLRLHVRGPVVPPETLSNALLKESRTRLADMYGSRAQVRASVSGTGGSQLDIDFELPLDSGHDA